MVGVSVSDQLPCYPKIGRKLDWILGWVVTTTSGPCQVAHWKWAQRRAHCGPLGEGTARGHQGSDSALGDTCG